MCHALVNVQYENSAPTLAWYYINYSPLILWLPHVWFLKDRVLTRIDIILKS